MLVTHKRLLSSGLFALLTVIATASDSAEDKDPAYQWVEKRHRDGIRIETRKVPGSKYRAVRGTMEVKGSIHSLVALVLDPSACPRWAHLCAHSKVYKQLSATDYYLYSYMDAPFPISNRDILAHVHWQQDPQSLRLTMNSYATVGLVPPTEAIRIEQATIQWHFTPQENNTTRVESFGHIDPNGYTPAWLSNILLINTPYKTMRNMKRLIESGAYADRHIDFIKSHRSHRQH